MSSETIRGHELEHGPDIRITLTGAERVWLLEALAGLSARTAEPEEVTRCFHLAQRLEGVREPYRTVLGVTGAGAEHDGCKS